MWDYLIVTASNETQGAAYERLLSQRKLAGQLPDFRHVMVVTDPDGKRIGSGGSTILCVLRVVEQERQERETLTATLRRLRIMIIHAGGDSRRLPAYGPCGKIFIPVPDNSPTRSTTLFDRLLPSYLALPPGKPGAGQLLVISGDVLLKFDASRVRLDLPGLVALGCYDTPEHSSKHGVFVADDTTVRLYLQKPSVAEQEAAGALNAQGRSALDIGVMSFDADAVTRMLQACEVQPVAKGKLDFSPRMRTAIFTHGLDLYREICCSLGTETTRARFLQSVRACGSKWDEAILDTMFAILHPMPCHVQVVPQCTFLHFGTTTQLISSGLEAAGSGKQSSTLLVLNTTLAPAATITGENAWIEGCRIEAPVKLAGKNVMVGIDVTHPLELPAGACLDIVPGTNRAGEPVHFVRCYDIGDTFKDPADHGGTFCGIPLLQWLKAAGMATEGIQSLWDAPVFPAIREHQDFTKWLWMFTPFSATPAQKDAYQAADRYSAAEIALLTNQAAFHSRRPSAT